MAKLPCNLSICVNASIIKPTTSVKNLGVYFDTYMTFENHITEMSKKAIGTIMYVNRIKDNFDKAISVIVIQ